MHLTNKEQMRYARQITLEELGVEGQLKLKKSRVLIIGAGGLGLPMLQYLAAAGIGHIGIVDFDIVELSNLHRQVLFSTEDIGKPKVEIASDKIRKLNPEISVIPYHVKLDRQNIFSIIENYDIIADGSDNFATRYLVNDACVKWNKTNVYASILKFEGQVSVFNYAYKDGTRSTNFRDLFPTPPKPNEVPSCAEGGVLGVLPGIIGSLQASEVIKIASGIGEPLANKLFTFNALNLQSLVLKIAPSNTHNIRSDNAENIELIDYDHFCNSINEISIIEFIQLKNSNSPFQLIDVREESEHINKNIGGINIPLSRFEDSIDEVQSNAQVIVYCQSGVRSKKAIQILQVQFKDITVLNLKGGMNAKIKFDLESKK